MMFPLWNYNEMQLSRVMCEIKKIFTEISYFSSVNSKNKKAGLEYKSQIEKFYMSCRECADKSREAYGDHYPNCPFLVSKTTKVPPELMEVLTNKEMDSETKKKNLKEMIMGIAKARNAGNQKNLN